MCSPDFLVTHFSGCDAAGFKSRHTRARSLARLIWRAQSARATPRRTEKKIPAQGYGKSRMHPGFPIKKFRSPPRSKLFPPACSSLSFPFHTSLLLHGDVIGSPNRATSASKVSSLCCLCLGASLSDKESLCTSHKACELSLSVQHLCFRLGTHIFSVFLYIFSIFLSTLRENCDLTCVFQPFPILAATRISRAYRGTCEKACELFLSAQRHCFRLGTYIFSVFLYIFSVFSTYFQFG